MAISKIILNGTTLMDVTGDTVTPNKLLLNETATRNDGTKITGSLSSSSLPTVDMEWVNVYSKWQAGYYYDPDNNYTYTQIPSTETSWAETTTYTAVSCTPYNNMIPVVAGEEYRYTNMPVHFDSKNAEIPSIILFDSNKDEVAAYTRTYQDEYTTFTIPSGAVWMAVIYANSQTYALQKHIVKIHDATDIAARVSANYRTYQLQTPPITRTLDKAYFCIGTDDLRPHQTKSLYTMFTINNIPYYMAAIPEAVKACVTDDPYKTNYDYMQLCIAAGGEIICHSDVWLTNSNAEDFNTLYKYFVTNKEELESYGFTIHGIFKAGGDGSISNADSRIDAWAAYYYDYSDTFGYYFPYDFLNRQFLEWITTNQLDQYVTDALTNHSFLCLATHEVNNDVQTNFAYLMNKLSNYTRGTDYDFITPYELYQKLMPA